MLAPTGRCRSLFLDMIASSLKVSRKCSECAGQMLSLVAANCRKVGIERNELVNKGGRPKKKTNDFFKVFSARLLL